MLNLNKENIYIIEDDLILHASELSLQKIRFLSCPTIEKIVNKKKTTLSECPMLCRRGSRHIYLYFSFLLQYLDQ